MTDPPIQDTPAVNKKQSTWALSILIFAVTFLAFLPALKGRFLNWDDQKLFLENTDYRGLGPNQVQWMLTTAKLGHYHPLTWITLGADYCIWGMNPRGYHLTNLLIHAANAVLVFWLAREILRAVRKPQADADTGLNFGAACAAILFSVHPLRVESVAWITERRDVLSLFFLLLCLRSYLRYAEGGPDKWKTFAFANIWLICSLLSKAWAMTLPAVLIVLDFYPLRRIRLSRADVFSLRVAKIFLEKIPFALAAAYAAKISLWAQGIAGMETAAQHDIYQRVAQACYGLIFYLQKTLLPIDLCPLYEIPTRMNPFEPRFVASAAGVVLITVVLILLRRRAPALLTSWLIYAIVASPVLGLTQTGPQLVADRYSYIACLPWAMLLGALAARRWQSTPSRTTALAGAAVIVLTLSVLTWRQTFVWRDSRSLWTRCLEFNPDSWNGLNNMGMLYIEEGDMPRALASFERSVDVHPEGVHGWANSALASARLGRTRDAVRFYREAVKRDTKDAELLTSIANGLSLLGAFDDSLPLYKKLLESKPNDVALLLACATAFKQAGKTGDAIVQFKRSVELLEGRMKNEDPFSPSRAETRGWYETAIRELADLLERNGDSTGARALRQKLFNP